MNRSCLRDRQFHTRLPLCESWHAALIYLPDARLILKGRERCLETVHPSCGQRPVPSQTTNKRVGMCLRHKWQYHPQGSRSHQPASSIIFAEIFSGVVVLLVTVASKSKRRLSSEAPQCMQTIAPRSFLFLQIGQNLSVSSKRLSPCKFGFDFRVCQGQECYPHTRTITGRIE